MTVGKFMMLLYLWCGMLFSAQAAPMLSLKDFDRIVPAVIKQAASPQLKLSPPVERDEKRMYIGEYAFKKTASGQHAMLVVAIAPGGSLLSDEAYRRRVDAVQQEQQTRQPGYAEYELPSYGKRALRRFLGFGPGGAGYGLVFTTSDGRYDVEVAVSSLLPMGTDTPEMDIDAIAGGIARRYDQSLR